MIYLKSLIAGIAVAVAVTIAWLAATLVLPLVVPLLMARITGNGSGGIGVAFGSGPPLIVAVLGFVAGFWWKFRRASKSAM